MMKRLSTTARQFLAHRRRGVIAVEPASTVLAALELMAAENLGAVLVIEGSTLVGILSERDYARRGELHGRVARDTPVRDVMHTDLPVIGPEHTFEQCMALMHQKRFQHLPVVEADRVLGVISGRDVLEVMLTEETHLARELEHERLQIIGDTGGSY